ncbi:uncharacterized protein LOC116716235 [Xiphophorus hellerii]|uniref:uncharacterized protein LOC116716235 n=2 Tax=Xiphophorus TaxID=8082 RepID=UPI0013B3D360|nr:uncharacterized protein LOC116716235 [Xiphophorus hellerii]
MASSNNSACSRSSGSAVSATYARAKAEAAKVRASYATKEAQLKVERAQSELEKAKIEATLEVITLQKEADAAVAEAQVLEEAEATQEEHDRRKALSEKSILERTSEYVQSQMGIIQSPCPEKAPTTFRPRVSSLDTFVSWHPHVEHSVEPQPISSEQKLTKDNVAALNMPSQTISEMKQNAHFNPTCSPFTPHRNTPASISYPVEPFAQYIARRDLITSGLYQFDDRPENYGAWYSSFCSATADVHLSPIQQLDLMTKWLGKESSDQVKRIRSVHVNNPTLALHKAWERLNECYAAPEIIEKSLFQRLDSFPRITVKDNIKLRELGDLLQEIESAKEDGYLPGLQYLDTSRGIRPIVEKLPHGLQERWMSHGSQYKEENRGCFPPFKYFCQFVCKEAKRRNDPSFHQQYGQTHSRPEKDSKNFFSSKPITVHKTNISVPNNDFNRNCPLHNKPHPLKKCRTFRNKPLTERKAFLKEKGICFKCCSSVTHLAKDCKSAVTCSECDSTSHDTIMHPGSPAQINKAPSLAQENGGEGENSPDTVDVITSCTDVCGPGQWGRSCSKICLAWVYPLGCKNRAVKAYVILDDQSNRSLARPEFFELFDIKTEPFSYNLRTCSGVVETWGKTAQGFQIESLDGSVVIPLPPLIECQDIPNNRSEIPTPSAVLHQPHLQSVAKYLPELDPKAEILLLLGRDVLRVHKVRQRVNGPHNAPFAQRLDLGWVVVGEVCLGNLHRPTVSTLKTVVLENGRPTVFEPCNSLLQLKEMPHTNRLSKAPEQALGQTVFNRTENDNKPAPSIQDAMFIKIMDNAMYRDEDNSWVAPLPFKEPRQRLPNNREQALTRFSSLKRNLNRKPRMQDQYVAFMGKIFSNGHAELAPPLKKDEECWYLPTFGVYHPQKPDQIRVVFDSSAQYQGVSLNNVLLTGPDLNNTLLGVLLRFRTDSIAIMADIQQMFHCFMVREDHRNFLRFLWHKDNDLNKEVIDYRMKVHVFGNSPSPAVAVYGLRKAIRVGAKEYGADTVKFVERHFYVDDGLVSVPSSAEAIDLLQRTQASLAESNLRLHKFVSNSQAVMQAFCPEDCAAVVKDLNLSGEEIQSQRSLGLIWEMTTDTFTYSVADTNRPFTRRGVLSSVNSVFDPLGLLAPVTIQGRALLRELTSECSDWDTPLPEDKQSNWETWKNSLQDLKELHVPRTFTSTSLSQATHKELCLFSDASTKAIGAVSYLKATQADGKVEVGFIMGKAKLTPLSEPTIPRLELCAAVLAVEMADLIQDELDLHFDAIHFYTDSKVVLGYICNDSRRFYTYVHNRTQRIRQSSKPEQWHYVRTEENPADHASRSLSAAQLKRSTWFTGPSFIRHPPAEIPHVSEIFDLIEPDKDSEIRPEIRTYVTHLRVLNSERFERFSTFKSLVRAIANLIHIAKSFNGTNPNSKCKGWHKCHLPRTPEEIAQAKTVILKETQKAHFEKELSALNAGKPISKQSPLQKLSPILQDGLISVGGRLKHSEIENLEKSPLILLKHSHISLLLTRHHHELVEHQGRHLTEGAIRAAGLWLLGCKTLVNSVIHKCVTCRKLRGKVEQQLMAALPPERLKTCSPFTYVGLDVFGPWTITARRTRGGLAESKRWAIMFTCMSSRAVHIEVIESLDTSSCVNALRRFFALRGPAKQLLSDRGTNFVGASKELGMDKSMQKYLTEQGCSWEFNPPHASHMGGSWERMIGVARRILDSMLLRNKIQLTHEVLCTLMAEITAIINARPLVPVSSDPENPFVLSPSMLITQKSCLQPPPGDFLDKDLYTKQWRQVQALSNQFWTRWRHEYLPTLQQRQKWTVSCRNLQVGDLVLLKDAQVTRNSWPMAKVNATFPGKDSRVRKIEVKGWSQGCVKTFMRPVTEVILLMPKD